MADLEQELVNPGAWTSTRTPETKKRKHQITAVKKKKARKNLTLVLPKTQGTLDNYFKPTRVRFNGYVLVKTRERVEEGYSLPTSDFLRKRAKQKLNMKQRHQLPIEKKTPRRVKIRQHVLETLEREKTME